MPIIVIVLLTASCARVPWPQPPFGFGGSGSMAMTAFAFLLPFGGAIVLSRWAVSSMRTNPHRRGIIANDYTKYRRILGYCNIVVAILAVVGLGWGWTVWNRMVIPSSDGQRLIPFGELLVPGPYILSIFMAWLVHFDAERAFHIHRPSGEQFWSRGGYFLYNLRHFALMILLPVLLMSIQQTFTRYAPETAESFFARILGVAVVPLMLIVLPMLLRPVLGLKPLPAGPTRERLEELARKFRFRYTNLYIWETRDTMANAFVTGLVPWARYVVFTDRLLETLSPDELDAVFAHEVGHVKHWHLANYVLFFLLSITVIGAGVSYLLDLLASRGFIDEKFWQTWAGLPTLAFLLVYLFGVFGLLSRRCERQADLYGCRAATGGTLSLTGIDNMARALTQVADINGMDTEVPHERQSLWKRLWALFQAWQHGSISERIRFLRQLAANPETEPAIQWRIFWLRMSLILLLTAISLALAALIGWEELAKSL